MSPRVRAVVRAERVKRAHGPKSPLWHRCIAFRERLMSGMSEVEWRETYDRLQADVVERWGKR